MKYVDTCFRGILQVFFDSNLSIYIIFYSCIVSWSTWTISLGDLWTNLLFSKYGLNIIKRNIDPAVTKKIVFQYAWRWKIFVFFWQLSAASVQSDQEGLGVVGRRESGPPPLTTCHSFTYSSLSTTLCQEFITFQHTNLVRSFVSKLI